MTHMHSKIESHWILYYNFIKCKFFRWRSTEYGKCIIVECLLRFLFLDLSRFFFLFTSKCNFNFVYFIDLIHKVIHAIYIKRREQKNKQSVDLGLFFSASNFFCKVQNHKTIWSFCVRLFFFFFCLSSEE